MRTFGELKFLGPDPARPMHRNDCWVITRLEPHVAIKLKATFNQIPKHLSAPFTMPATREIANDLEWFLMRYPMAMSETDRGKLTADAQEHREQQEELAALFTSGFTPRKFNLLIEPRDYQARAVELYLKTKRLLVGDAVGLGKTAIAICSFVEKQTLPALVVVQAHLPKQWRDEITKFLGAKCHIIKTGKPYELPPAEIYICSYSKLAGWVDVFCSGFLKAVVFDEVQEVRRSESKKHETAAAIAEKCEFAMGLSATPIYNYGDEIWNIYNVIKPGALGSFSDFSREWCGRMREVQDPPALGSFLRENHLFIRRTRAEVGRELPPVNTVIHTVGHDQEAIDKVEDLARVLALKVTRGSFQESGEAARELDIMLRLVTGVSKARFVAQYVRILLENKEPVLLAGWHRDVYEIWNQELAEFKPVMFTGSESPAQKRRAKEAFINGETDLMFISLRSGVGLDGLQKRCAYVVFGELDWSPGIHEQVIGRLWRDGQHEQVTAVYLVSDGGSDPLVVDLLGLKSSQAAGIVDPFAAGPKTVHSDESRIKALAKFVLEKRGQGEPQLELA